MALTKELISNIWLSKELFNNLFHLCDEFGPRPAGSTSAKEAANFIIQKLEDYNLETSIQPFSINYWIKDSSSITYDGLELKASPYHFSGNGDISGRGSYFACRRYLYCFRIG